jgi:hypothetical protein
MRYRLRTLLIVAALAPMVIGGPIAIYISVDRWVKGEYKKVFDEIREKERAKALPAKQVGTANVPLSTP